MRVGLLRIPFVILQEKADATWENVSNVWGKLRAIKKDDAATHEVFVRVSRDFVIETGMKLVWAEREFLVLDVLKIKEMERFLRVLVKEIRCL